MYIYFFIKQKRTRYKRRVDYQNAVKHTIAKRIDKAIRKAGESTKDRINTVLFILPVPISKNAEL